MAKKLFSPTAEPIPEDGYVFWRFLPGLSRLPELSSMNFVLKQNADMRDYEGKHCDHLQDYFTFGFWSFPERGFSNSTIIVNDEKSVHFTLKASKSIYIPGKPYVAPMDLGMEKQLPVEMLTLWGLRKDQSRYQLEKIEDVVVTKGVANSLEDERRRGRFLINGIVCEFRKRETRFPTLTAVDLYEVSHLELFMSIIGLVVSEKFQEATAISKVTNLENLKKETEHILRLVLSKAGLDRTIADSIPDQFSLALEYLNPIVVADEPEVFYMHPSVFLALVESGLFDRLTKNKLDLINVLRLLEMIPAASDTEILRSKESAYLRSRGFFPEIILSSLKPAIGQIYLTRILRNPSAQIPAIVREEKVPKPSLVEKELIVSSSDRQSFIDVITEKEKEIFRHLDEEERRLRKAKIDR